jgi:hypothetical protein
MPPDLSDVDHRSIETDLLAGRKISAIKTYREATGSGLKEAKDAVEVLEADLRATSPGRFHSPPAKAGCLPMIPLLIAPALLAVWLWRQPAERSASAFARPNGSLSPSPTPRDPAAHEGVRPDDQAAREVLEPAETPSGAGGIVFAQVTAPWRGNRSLSR